MLNYQQALELKMQEYHETIEKYKKIVMDQEIELVDLQVEACLRASDYRELQKELEWYKSTMKKRNSDA